MHRILLTVSTYLCLCVPLLAQTDRPQSTDPDVVIELFAEHPQLVTPTGLAVDAHGRIFVAESHTHFRPDDYDGPSADRILIFEDADRDGRADERTVFHEGFTYVMDIAFHPDGTLYVATRKDIHRMRDTDGDDHADEVTRIINLETTGNYPHNGISGLTFHIDGRLTFGLGENLGHDYTLVGTDGKRLSGGGEGGSTYQVRADGTHLRRVSTGWWNPFGTCVDAFGRVFGTDNDPGASPPCRLIQVIESGDYAYEYRYGRTGLHPLISWTGATPGALPMISGTGEAPCGVLAYESDALPETYRGRLLVASWADHRVEHYKLEQPAERGLVKTKREILIQGHNEFRPVDLSLAPDGTVYLSDWVSSSYSLHKLGRIWRIRPKQLNERPRPTDPDKALLSRHGPTRDAAAWKLANDVEKRRTLVPQIPSYKDVRTRAALVRALGASHAGVDGFASWIDREPDPRIRVLAVRALGTRQKDVSRWANDLATSVRAEALLHMDANHHSQAVGKALDDTAPLVYHAGVTALARSAPDAIGRFLKDHPAAALLAMRRSGRFQSDAFEKVLIDVLKSADPDARYVAVKWIADEQRSHLRPHLVELLKDPKLQYRTFRALAAAIDRLDGKKPSDAPSPRFLLDRINDEQTPGTLLELCLRQIDPTFKGLQLEHLIAHTRHEDPGVRLEAVRTLARHPDPDRAAHLVALSTDKNQPIEIRAAAVAGLGRAAQNAASAVRTLIDHAAGTNAALQDEALRALVGAKLTAAQRRKLQRETGQRVAEAVRRILGGTLTGRPAPENLDAWAQLLEGPADPAAGERIFFGTQVGTCAKCHQINGRGTAIGPDLTQINRRLEAQGEGGRRWLLETILQPSKDMAPQYTPWIILTTNGKTLTGLPRRKGGTAEAYLGVDGKEFTVKKPDIASHRESDVSLMPQDLLKNLTEQEVRDLFAFLVRGR